MNISDELMSDNAPQEAGGLSGAHAPQFKGTGRDAWGEAEEFGAPQALQCLLTLRTWG